MKKIFLFLLTCCLGQTGMLRAADTDISSLDNVIYIESFSAKPGSSELDVSIKMKNTAAIRGFQFNLTLPEGVAPATYGNGSIKCTLSTGRLGEGDQHTINVEAQADGSYKFLCGSLADETFTGTDGEVAVLKVNIAPDMSEGSYPLVLTAMKLTETDISKYYETERVEATLTIDNSIRTVLDETSTTAPEAVTGVDVLVKRTIKANEWSTICLPFAMSEEQVKEAFGSDVLLGDFNGYEKTEDNGGDIIGITVKFNLVTAIEANHPYVIKVSTTLTEFTVDGVDINPEEKPTKAAVKRTKRQWSEMIGTYVANTPVGDAYEEAWCLFLSDNKFWYSMGQTKIKAYRAYFDFFDVITSVENTNDAPVFFSFDNETTSINLVKGEGNVTNGEVYNLNGHRVMSPNKGLFIKNGKKVIVK